MFPQRASYACTALVGTNKSGRLRSSEDGYYPVVLGALNVFNSGGAYYPYEAAKGLFDESSAFQRRIRDGALRGECGHPRRSPNMTNRDFYGRVMDIYEPNISHHIRRVWLDDTVRDSNGIPVIAIMGEVKPAGPMGPSLKEALENPSENVCFSIRSFTDDQMIGGTLNKRIKTIVTWDWVNEPGLSAAKKWNAPALESLEDFVVTRFQLEQVAFEQAKNDLVAMESSGTVTARSVLRDLGWIEPANNVFIPRSSSW